MSIVVVIPTLERHRCRSLLVFENYLEQVPADEYDWSLW